jgi:RNA polymerase sigma-70 factor (ECF subfamily)
MDDQKREVETTHDARVSLTDEDLLRCVARDEGALQELQRRFGARIRRVARSAGMPPDDLPDFEQAVWVEVWQHSRRFDAAKGSAAAWIFQIARHRMIDALRRRRPVVALEDVAERAAPGDVGDDVDRLWIQAGLARLAPRERRLLELAYWGGFSQQEVADLWRVPLGTVKSWNRRALMRLRAVMEGEDGGRDP